MWELYAPHHNVEQGEFLERAQGFDRTALLRSLRTGALVGFTGLRYWHVPMPGGGKALTLYLGQTFVTEAYRGHDFVQKTVIRTTLLPWLLTPWMSVYFWSDCISYKPYLLAARNLGRFFPSPHWTTPSRERHVIDSLGNRYYGDDYRPDSGTVVKKSNRLRDHVAPLTDEMMQDPHIQFYAESNPGYQHGDGLIALYPATFSNLIHFLKRRIKQLLRGKKR